MPEINNQSPVPNPEQTRDELTGWVIADIDSQIARAEDAAALFPSQTQGASRSELRIAEQLDTHRWHLQTARGSLSYSDGAPSAKERLNSINETYLPKLEPHIDTDEEKAHSYASLLGEREVLTDAIARAEHTQSSLHGLAPK